MKKFLGVVLSGVMLATVMSTGIFAQDMRYNYEAKNCLNTTSEGLNKEFEAYYVEAHAQYVYESELISLDEAIKRGYTIVSLSEILELEGYASGRFTFDNRFTLSSTQWTRVPGSGTNATLAPITFFIFNDEANPGNLAVEVMWNDTNQFIARNTNIPRGMGISATIPGATSLPATRTYRINLRAASVPGNYRVVSMMQ